MRYPLGTRRVTGVLVSVASLRTSQTVGCGEFRDLVQLADWCKSVNVSLIQILPINDTGDNSSPYSAVSAFALHPVYVSVDSLPEYGSCSVVTKQNIAALCEAQRTADAQRERIDYPGALRTKMQALRAVYDNATIDPREIAAYVEANAWVKPYAVYRAIKDSNQGASWVDWPSYQNPDFGLVSQLWEDATIGDSARFFAWIQLRAEAQLSATVERLSDAGIALKGDIPILMDQDSADVWFERTIFRLDVRAGAPPDMFSELGQNWGFPVYNWDTLRRDDFGWWRRRISQASRFYHAYRIDHVLGFFRIWTIRATQSSGALGYFEPQRGFTQQELVSHGFDVGRTRWLAEPHVYGSDVRARFSDGSRSAPNNVFTKLEGEDLYLFDARIGGERDLEALEVDEDTTQ